MRHNLLVRLQVSRAAGGGGVPSGALLWDDSTPLLWDDASYLIWS